MPSLAKKETGLKVVSFAGFLPVEKPAVTIYVVVDEPHGEHVGGSTVAAPAFASLAGKLMLYLGVTPDKIPGHDKPRETVKPVRGIVPVPPAGNLIQGRNRDSLDSNMDPVGQFVDAALAPLPGSGGVDYGSISGDNRNLADIDSGREIYSTESENNIDPFGDTIGRVIDAQVQKTYILGTEGRTPYTEDNR